jgi:hypothetical protein
MSRPNTSKKLRARIMALFRRADGPLTLDVVKQLLEVDAKNRGYPPPESYPIHRIVGEFKEKGALEIVEPLFPPHVDAYSNRELRVLEWRYVRYQIPTLNRLAMVVDEE